jgi:hypothetical protein
MVFLLGDEIQLVQRSAWVMGQVLELYYELAEPWWKQLIHAAMFPVHEAVTRNVLRVLDYAGIPESYEGTVITWCFDLLNDPAAPIAARCYAMGVIAEFSVKEPLLVPELVAILEEEYDRASPAFRARARKVLKEIGKRKEPKGDLKKAKQVCITAHVPPPSGDS